MQIRKIFFAAVLLVVNGIANADNGQTYTLDKRRYLNGNYPSGMMHTKRWGDWPYSQVVEVDAPNPKLPLTSFYVGTGTFISPKHVLTNKHVANCCGVPGTSMAQHNCTITLHDGTTMLANVVMTGGSNGTEEDLKNKCLHTSSDNYTGTDWAILELTSPAAIQSRGNEHLDLSNAPLNDNTPVDFRAGFGGLQILSDEQIRTIKQAYQDVFGTTKAETSTTVRYNGRDQDIFIEDAEMTEAQIAGLPPQYKTYAEAAVEYYGRFLTRHREISKSKGKEEEFLDFLYDPGLKIIENCSITLQYQTRFKHTCYAWSGDSGSALVTNDKVLGVLTSGADYIIGANEECLTGQGCDFGIPAKQINTRATQHILDAAFTAPEPTTTEQTPNPVPEQEATVTPEPTLEQTPESEAPTPTITDANPDNAQQPRTAPARQRHTAKNIAIATAATAAIAAAAVGINAANINNKADKQKKHTPQAVASQNNARAIGANCAADDMPANAERGEYAAVNIKKLNCNGQQCACVVTKCKNGYKLVYKEINGKWESMGYCINPKPCTTGQPDTDVIDDVHIIRQHGGNFCKRTNDT